MKVSIQSLKRTLVLACAFLGFVLQRAEAEVNASIAGGGTSAQAVCHAIHLC